MTNRGTGKASCGSCRLLSDVVKPERCGIRQNNYVQRHLQNDGGGRFKCTEDNNEEAQPGSIDVTHCKAQHTGRRKSVTTLTRLSKF